jgi:toxin ParE1/3/4
MARQWAPGADADLDDIWYYVATESGNPDRADRFVASLTERFYLLASNPFIGRSRDDLRPGLRTFPVGQYVVVYRIDDEDVVILHVFHGSRDIEAFFHP